MIDKIKFTDRIQSRNRFENFVESYLHLNGWGRKFILIKGCVNGKENSLIEVKDPITFKKILGNAGRLLSYIVIFPLPLISLAIRSWQRNHRQITLNPFQGNPALEQRYRKLAEESINAPFFPIKTLADKVNYRLVGISEESSDKIYQQLVEILSQYKELAPEALLLFTKSLVTGGDVGGDYEKHLLTLKFLKSQEGAQLIPEADRAVSAAKIQTYLNEKLIKARQAPAETAELFGSRQYVIQRFLSSIFPANKPILSYSEKIRQFVPEMFKQDRVLANELMQEIFDLDPRFWQENRGIIEKIANSESTMLMADNSIANAKLFLDFLKTKATSAQ